MPKEDEPRGIIAPLKEKIGLVVSALAPANIMKQIVKMKAMAPPELLVYILTNMFWLLCMLGLSLLSVLSFLLTLMRGSLGQEEKSAKELELLKSKGRSKSLYYQSALSYLNVKISPVEGKPESQDAGGGEADKEEAARKKSVGVQSDGGRKSGVHLGEDERRISLFIPSQDLTVHSLKTSDL